MQHPSVAYYLGIEDQPAPEVRFRYVAEKRSSSERLLATKECNKIFPVLSTNYRGRITIIVVLVDKHKRAHPHSLVGPKCVNGICIFETDVSDENSKIVFRQNVSIQCAKKPDVTTKVRERLALPHGDPFFLGYDPESKASIDLHEVRLAFIALVRDASSGCWCQLHPIVTDVVRDAKASLKLNIIHTSECSGPANGSELILLTDTVYDPSSVKVLFYGHGWQAYAEVTRFHKSVAFVIRVPQYRDVRITDNVHVEFVLTRKSECVMRGDRLYDPSADRTKSNSVSYQYYPGPEGQADAIAAKSLLNVPAPNLRDTVTIKSLYHELMDIPLVTELFDNTIQNQEPPPVTPHQPMGQSSSIEQHLPNGPYDLENSLLDRTSSSTRSSSMGQSSYIKPLLPNGPYNLKKFLLQGTSSSTRCSSMGQSSSIEQHIPNGPYDLENSLLDRTSSTTRRSSMGQSSAIEQHLPNGPYDLENSLLDRTSSSTRRSSMGQSSSIKQLLPNGPYDLENSLLQGTSASSRRSSMEQSSSIEQHLPNGTLLPLVQQDVCIGNSLSASTSMSDYQMLSLSSVEQLSPSDQGCSSNGSPFINAAPPTVVGHRGRSPAMEHNRSWQLQHRIQGPSREPASNMNQSSDLSNEISLSQEFSKLSSSSSSDNSAELKKKKMKYK